MNDRSLIENRATFLRHVFISYAHEDAAFVAMLAADLQGNGIDVWVDHEGLQPGTPHWETAIRQAIRESFAVLLISSPSSRRSQAVFGEVTIASDLRCPIIPVWAEGTTWSDCVPLTLVSFQNVDCRGEHYATGCTELLTRLRVLMHESSPEFVELDADAVAPSAIPPQYFSLQLDERTTVATRVHTHASLVDLLNTLYMRYLTEKFSPFTYGKEWVLREVLPDGNVASRRRTEDGRLRFPLRLLVPIPWLAVRHETEWYPMTARYTTWANASLANHDIIPHTCWEVVDLRALHRLEALGVVAADDQLATELFEQGKRQPELFSIKILPSLIDKALAKGEISSGGKDTQSYSFQRVIQLPTHAFWLRADLDGKVVILDSGDLAMFRKYLPK